MYTVQLCQYLCSTLLLLTVLLKYNTTRHNMTDEVAGRQCNCM